MWTGLDVSESADINKNEFSNSKIIYLNPSYQKIPVLMIELEGESAHENAQELLEGQKEQAAV